MCGCTAPMYPCVRLRCLTMRSSTSCARVYVRRYISPHTGRTYIIFIYPCDIIVYACISLHRRCNTCACVRELTIGCMGASATLFLLLRLSTYTDVVFIQDECMYVLIQASSYIEERISESCMRHNAPNWASMCAAHLYVWAHPYVRRSARALSVGVDCVRLRRAGVQVCVGFPCEHRRVEHRVRHHNIHGMRRNRPAARHRGGCSRPVFDAARPLCSVAPPMHACVHPYARRNSRVLSVDGDRVRLILQAFVAASAFNANIGEWNTASVTSLSGVCAAIGRHIYLCAR